MEFRDVDWDMAADLTVQDLDEALISVESIIARTRSREMQFKLHWVRTCIQKAKETINGLNQAYQKTLA